MKIKLIKDIVVDPKHEMYEGRTFDVIKLQSNRYGGVWVKGAIGEDVLVRRSEFVIIKEDENG